MGVPERAIRCSAFQQAGGAGELGGGVLDRLRLVEHHHPVLVLEQQVLVAQQQGVAGEHDVVVLDLVEQLAPLIAVQDEHGKVGRELARLVAPGRHQAGGADDQAGLDQVARVALGQDMGESLDGLPQAHIVGEHARQAQAAQELQPGEAVLLIVAQGGLEALGRCDGRDLAGGRQLARHVAQHLAAGPLQRAVGQGGLDRGEPGHLGTAQAQLAVVADPAAGEQLVQRLQHGFQAGGGDRQQPSVGQSPEDVVLAELVQRGR